MTRRLAVFGWLLLGVAIADWWALRNGVVHHPPSLLAVVVVTAVPALAARLAVQLAALARRGGRILPKIAEATLLAGVLFALGAGSANWLLGLQGFVILNEREAVRLDGGGQLQAFEAGPLARLEEMRLFLALNELDLVAEGSSGFLPVSSIDVWREGGEKQRLEVNPRAAASRGVLRFHQGAFGFAPRIVILKGKETLFDRIVPFTTERSGPSGISFAGRFNVEREALEVDGQVDLASLDEGMRGHASLLLTVWQNGELVGRGHLLPGQFADIEEGYRVGFAGLEQWSEIVISRRNYGRWVLAGCMLALAGAVLLPIAIWRSR
jgi:hypothetical protein